MLHYRKDKEGRYAHKVKRVINFGGKKEGRVVIWKGQDVSEVIDNVLLPRDSDMVIHTLIIC